MRLLCVIKKKVQVKAISIVPSRDRCEEDDDDQPEDEPEDDSLGDHRAIRGKEKDHQGVLALNHGLASVNTVFKI